MCSLTGTSGSTGRCSTELARLAEALDRAEAVVVGAGAGLSASAGLLYAGPRFEENFPDFIAKYGCRDMYAAAFQRYATPEEHWAYWSRHILLNRYGDIPGGAYRDLLALLAGREHFVLTTNVDHCFKRSGFDKARLFYTQGDYGLWQCSVPCRQETWDNEETVRRMAAEQRDMGVPSELVPRCPHCGAPMAMNLRCDNTFVQDGGWYAARGRCEDFLRRHVRGRVLYLELGVGWNTPGIVKYPFWRLSAQNREAVYACLNLGDACAPPELAGRSICVDGDVGGALHILRERL